MNLNADVEIQPKAETWLGSLVEAVQTNAEGRMSIADANAMMSMDSNLDIAKLGEVLRPKRLRQ